MNDLIRELKELRIEQSQLVQQVYNLDNKINNLENRIQNVTQRKPTSKTDVQPKSGPSEESDLQVGDIVVLLTKGVRCRKGDRARVSKITSFPYACTVYFIVLRNNHNTHKNRTNVRKE